MFRWTRTATITGVSEELAIAKFDQPALVRAGSLLRAWLKGRVFEREVPDYYGPDAGRSANYDYVLVDSRTGMTESGGLCIGPLCDQIVVFTALNDQNVEGTRRFLEEVGVLARPQVARGAAAPAVELGPGLQSKPTMIVASPVPAGEIAKKTERLRELGRAIGRRHREAVLSSAVGLAGKTIFTRDWPDEYLATEYLALTGDLLRTARDGATRPVVAESVDYYQGPPAKRREILGTACAARSHRGQRPP